MVKKNSLLLILLIILLGLASYLILSSGSLKNKLSLKQVQEPSGEERVLNYQSRVKEIFNDYSGLNLSEGLTKEKTTELKGKLLDLKVPAEFKQLHVNFVLALTHLENYLSGRQTQEKILSRQIIEQIKADYGWLNK